MTKKDKEVTDKVNASETTKEESGSEKENPEDSKETKRKAEPLKEEEAASDYLEEKPEEEVDYKKRYGDSTREYQSLKTEKDRLSKALANLEGLAKTNPKIVEEIEAAQEQIGKDSPVGDNLGVQKQINEALEPVKKIAQEFQQRDRQSKIKALIAFEKKNPELFDPKATKEEKKAVRQRVGKVANTLVETGMPYSEALKRAHLTVNPKAAIKEGKDKAYLEGITEEQAGFSGQTSSEGKKPGKPKYTKEELEAAKKLGPKVYQAMIEETK